jgi:hypothetical protein
MNGWFEYGLYRQRSTELLREAEQERLAKQLAPGPLRRFFQTLSRRVERSWRPSVASGTAGRRRHMAGVAGAGRRERSGAPG